MLALDMQGIMMSFHEGTDWEQTEVLDYFLYLGETQAAQEHTGSPTPRLEGIILNNAIRT